MPYLPYTMQKEETTMESYVERWARSRKKLPRRKPRKRKAESAERR